MQPSGVLFAKPAGKSMYTHMKEAAISDLRRTYLHLINHTLPGAYTRPVRFNHCFARIILDWTFGDVWRHHLHNRRPAYLQLSSAQLTKAIERMQAWLQQPQLLVQDNQASLSYRKNYKKAANAQSGMW